MQSQLEELQNQLENASTSTAESSSILQSENDGDDVGRVNGASFRFATFSAGSDVQRDFPELFGNCVAREAVDVDEGSSNLSADHADDEDDVLVFDDAPPAHGTLPNATAAPRRISKAPRDFDENSTLSSEGLSHLGNEEAAGQEEAPSTRTPQAIPSGSAMTVQYFGGANGRHEDYDDASTVASSVRVSRAFKNEQSCLMIITRPRFAFPTTGAAAPCSSDPNRAADVLEHCHCVEHCAWILFRRNFAWASPR